MSDKNEDVLDDMAPTVGSTPAESAASVSEEQLKGYALFLAKLKEPSAAPLVARVKQFVSRFPMELKRDQASARMHEFVSKLESELPTIEAFADGADEEYANAKEGLEKLILKPLHQHFFEIDSDDKRLDDQITSKITRIAPLIKLGAHLHGPPELVDDGVLELAIEEFRRIDAYRAPRDKMQCILNGFRVIRHALDTVIGPSRWGADQLLPVCIYTIIKANPPSLNSNVNFVSSFRHPSRLRGEDEYLLMQMNIALRDIANIEEVLLRPVEELSIVDITKMWKKFHRMAQRLAQNFPENQNWQKYLHPDTTDKWTVGNMSEFVKAYAQVVEEFNRTHA